MSTEKAVTYTNKNTYTTLNDFTEKTKNVWLVFHGMGYLSKYFVRYFSEISKEENYIIAPQAPSKYYQGKDFKHVGASWLTRENTIEETKNVLNYIDAIWKNEKPKKETINLIILGYSQGVSIAARWAASRKIQCNHLVLHSGAIPTELEPADFNYLHPNTKVTYIYGDKDEYINEARKTEQTLKGNKLFGNKLNIIKFEGIHEVYKPFLKQLAEEYS
jgi:predicted esterase